MTRYLFINAHGPKVGPDPVGDLAQSKDANTVVVPINWTPASEANRDAILKQLGLNSISSLPCVVWFEPEHQERTIDEETGETVSVTIPDRWVEHRFVETAKADWTWSKIDAAIVARATN